MAGQVSTPASEDASGTKELTTEHVELEKGAVVDDVSIRNQYAYKGDDSDGKVAWPLRHCVAAVSLGMLYAG